VSEPAPFRVSGSTEPSPLIVEIPHAGTFVPQRYQSNLIAPVRSLSRDADLYVDKLWEEALQGLPARLLIAHWSRLVVDLNRAEEAVDAEAVVGARPHPSAIRGSIWRVTSDRDPVLRRRLSTHEYEERLQAAHRPYHQALRDLIADAKERFGFAVVIAAHSMPSAPRAADPSAKEPRAQVVPGTRGKTSAALRLIDTVERACVGHGASVKHDVPYRGGFTTEHYGKPRLGQHVIQIELSRALYMHEEECVLHEGFAATVQLCQQIARALLAQCAETTEDAARLQDLLAHS
jgi:N-formylglutamate deformylase